MRLILSLLFTMVLYAQGPEVSISQLPPLNPGQLIYGYSGTNLIYTCYAHSGSSTPSGPNAISGVSKANPAIVTSSGHGFNVNSRPKVTISGATGTGWTAINATWTATILDANTFSIPIDSTGFGTLAGTVIFTTTAPQTNQPVWAVKLYTYDGSNNLIFSAWLNGSLSFTSKCSDATSSTLNAQ